jgi:hypothetical protein
MVHGAPAELPSRLKCRKQALALKFRILSIPFTSNAIVSGWKIGWRISA